MKKLRNLVLIVSLVLVFSMSIVLLACNFSADEEPFEAQDHRFLTADGVDFVNANGEKVFLKGINAGGLFVQEEWMCPVESKDTITTYNILISRFGYDRAIALIKAYQDAWWTEEDFDNVKEIVSAISLVPGGVGPMTIAMLLENTYLCAVRSTNDK